MVFIETQKPAIRPLLSEEPIALYAAEGFKTRHFLKCERENKFTRMQCKLMKIKSVNDEHNLCTWFLHRNGHLLIECLSEPASRAVQVYSYAVKIKQR